jgi:S-adenosylmethionine hydrolase
MPAVITLTSDYGYRDYFAGAMRGLLLSQGTDIQIVDISHQVAPYNIPEAAYTIRNAYPYFPKGSVHVVLVDTVEKQGVDPLAMHLDGHYFIGANNGLFPIIRTDLTPDLVVSLGANQVRISNWHIFARAAHQLASGLRLSELGAPFSEMERIGITRPSVHPSGDSILGNVIYIDNFGNLVTNISKALIQEVGRGRDLQIQLPRNKTLKKLSNNYHDATADGQLGALINSGELLEIFLYKSGETLNGASSMLGMRIDDSVNISFK